MFGMVNVVLRPAGRVAQDLIRLGQGSELIGVTGGVIIRMKTLRQDPVNPMDRLRIGIDADLEDFVVVGVNIRHGYLQADRRRRAYSPGAKYPSVAVTTRPGSRGRISTVLHSPFRSELEEL